MLGFYYVFDLSGIFFTVLILFVAGASWVAMKIWEGLQKIWGKVSGAQTR